MKKIFQLAACLLLMLTASCGPDCDPCSKLKFIEPERMLFLGKERVKIHGPVTGRNNYEEVQHVTLYKYLIDGHDYTYGYIDGARIQFGMFHSPSCRKCEGNAKEDENRYQELLSGLEDLIESNGRYVTKEQIETLLKKQEKNIVKQFDDILDSWD